MKYLLDMALIIGLVWFGYLWNGERKNGLAQGDEISRLEALSGRLEKDLEASKAREETLTAELAAARDSLNQTGGELAAATAALDEKTKEADALKDAGRKLRTRVAELEGYKAKAIVAEMPAAVATP
ncbi:MAG: hypothetical protein GX548_05930 [Lentisphaerae bacterium]|nr:hypothetical protein [Lentisphaerota bacterium]